MRRAPHRLLPTTEAMGRWWPPQRPRRADGGISANRSPAGTNLPLGTTLVGDTADRSASSVGQRGPGERERSPSPAGEPCSILRAAPGATWRSTALRMLRRPGSARCSCSRPRSSARTARSSPRRCGRTAKPSSSRTPTSRATRRHWRACGDLPRNVAHPRGVNLGVDSCCNAVIAPAPPSESCVAIRLLPLPPLRADPPPPQVMDGGFGRLVAYTACGPDTCRSQRPQTLRALISTRVGAVCMARCKELVSFNLCPQVRWRLQ